MLTYSADFWPLFWLIIGSGALLTALAALLVATFSPAWFGGHLPSKPARLAESGPAPQEPSGRLPKAA